MKKEALIACKNFGVNIHEPQRNLSGITANIIKSIYTRDLPALTSKELFVIDEQIAKQFDLIQAQLKSRIEEIERLKKTFSLGEFDYFGNEG